jgi:hypothetical protein
MALDVSDTSLDAVTAFITSDSDLDSKIQVPFPFSMFLFLYPKSLAEHCIVASNLTSLKLLVDNGCSTSSLLSCSILQLNRASFDYLLTRSVDINELDSQRRTPLHLAVHVRHLYFVRRLLEHGADASIPDEVPFPFLKTISQF